MIYMEYLEGEDRDYFIEQSKNLNDMNKGFALLEMVHMQYEQMCKDAELKVLTEGGTYDDLEYLYSEAEAANQEQQDGVLKQIWSAIVNFFKGIWNFLFGKGKDVPDDAELEVPGGIGTVAENIKNMFQSQPTLAKVAEAVLGGSFAVIGLQTAYVKVTKKNCDTWLQVITNAVTNAKDAVVGWLEEGLNKILKTIGVKKEDGTPYTVQDFFNALTKFIDDHIKKPINTAIDKWKANHGNGENQSGSGDGNSTDNNDTSGNTDANAPQVSSNSQGTTSSNAEGDKGADKANTKSTSKEDLTNASTTTKKNTSSNSNPSAPENAKSGNAPVPNNDTVTGGKEVRRADPGVAAMNKANDVKKQKQDKKIIENRHRLTKGIKHAGAEYKLSGSTIMKKGPQDVEFTKIAAKDADPALVKKIEDMLGGDTKLEATVDVALIREALGDNYLVEVADDGEFVHLSFIGENADDDIFALPMEALFASTEEVKEESALHDISTEESIFGSLDDDYATEQAKLDKEIAELEAFFED